MEPPVRAVFTVAEIEDKLVCSAEIPSIDLSERPCYYKGVGRVKGSYIRVGDADLPMTDYELYSYEAFRKHLYDDERPIERASLKAQGYLPQLGITAIVVPGTEIGNLAEDSARFLDNKRIEGTPVQLDFFSNRVEIHSPGCLYGRTTVEQLGHSRPDLRNPALAVMAEALTDSENRYSGIPTIRREMAAYGLPAPVFENRRDEFVVTLCGSTRFKDAFMTDKNIHSMEPIDREKIENEVQQHIRTAEMLAVRQYDAYSHLASDVPSEDLLKDMVTIQKGHCITMDPWVPEERTIPTTDTPFPGHAVLASGFDPFATYGKKNMARFVESIRMHEQARNKNENRK